MNYTKDDFKADLLSIKEYGGFLAFITIVPAFMILFPLASLKYWPPTEPGAVGERYGFAICSFLFWAHLLFGDEIKSFLKRSVHTIFVNLSLFFTYLAEKFDR